MQEKSEEVVASALKELLANAVLLGMSCAEKAFAGSVFDEPNQDIVSNISSLHRSTDAFLATTGMEGITAHDIVPLYQEVVGQLQIRRS